MPTNAPKWEETSDIQSGPSWEETSDEIAPATVLSLDWTRRRRHTRNTARMAGSRSPRNRPRKTGVTSTVQPEKQTSQLVLEMLFIATYSIANTPTQSDKRRLKSLMFRFMQGVQWVNPIKTHRRIRETSPPSPPFSADRLCSNPFEATPMQPEHRTPFRG